MGYRKFDDPSTTREDAPRKVYDTFWKEAERRAIQSVCNRIIHGTSGTAGGTSFNVGLGTASTAGLKLNYGVTLMINGRMGTMAPQDNIYLPKGTQGTGKYVKYLVAAKFGTGATCFAGNESTSSTGARLPDCPDGYVAVGYCEYVTSTAGPYIRFGGGTAGGYNVLSGNTAGTCGTVNAMVDLVHMPYSEV